MTTERAVIKDVETAIKLAGNFDENLKFLSQAYDVSISVKDYGMAVAGEDIGAVKSCRAVLETLATLIDAGEEVDKARIKYCMELERKGQLDTAREVFSRSITVSARGKPVKCRTPGQQRYVDAIKNNAVVIATGPAGTGKTYLAVAYAAAAFKAKFVERIILTRPAVEAGEKLGFLPGDMQMKVDPYLRPLYDALAEMFGQDNYLRLIERQQIEVAPLAYMRGRTLASSFIILDEAQNTTPEQMKMFLTRIGEGSKMVINGDVTQIDLTLNKTSGIIDAAAALGGVKDIEIIKLTHKDVVRRELVADIIKAYEDRDKLKQRRFDAEKAQEVIKD